MQPENEEEEGEEEDQDQGEEEEQNELEKSYDSNRKGMICHPPLTTH